jgi:hypothetical protein
MMKYFLYILLGAVLLSGCSKKTDELFDDPADIRLQKALDAYKQQLMQAPGWKLFVYPKGLESQGIDVGGLTYYVTFPDSNRTVMVSDLRSSMAGVPKESSYRLKGAQLPSLVFDTYNYIHIAADPDENVSFSPTGAGGFGWGSDFDLGFTKLEPGDSMTLRGNFNSSTAYLIQATQEEIDAAFNGRLAQILNATEDYSESNPFLYFNSSDNTRIGLSFNLALHVMNFNYLQEGNLVTVSVPFSFTVEGIHFKNPVTIGGYTFQDAYWDDAQDRYYINLPEGGRVDIMSSPDPLFPFNIALGRLISAIVVPTTPLPGQSATFATVYAEIKNNLKTSGFNLDLDDMNFIFDAESQTMLLAVIVTRPGQVFLAQYQFGYAFNSSGLADFTFVTADGNGNAVFNDMLPLLQYLQSDLFELDYFDSGSGILGQFTSEDNPDFFFTGTLQ